MNEVSDRACPGLVTELVPPDKITIFHFYRKIGLLGHNNAQHDSSDISLPETAAKHRYYQLI